MQIKSKAFWGVNAELDKSSKIEDITKIIHENKKVHDGQKLAEIFNCYFVNVVKIMNNASETIFYNLM